MRLLIALILSMIIVLPALAGPRYAIGVDGLACPFCAYGLEKRLLQVAAVVSVETDVSAGRLVVEVKDNAELSREQADKAIEDAGFTLRSFEALPQ